MKVLNYPMGLPMITLCTALKEIGIDATSVQFTSHSFKFEPDICLNLERVATSQVKSKIINFLNDASNKYDIFHYHDMPKGPLFTPTQADLKILQQSGKPMIIQHHGSEVRRLTMARSFGNPHVQVKSYWKNEKIIINRLTKWGQIFDHAVIADYELYPYIKDYYKHIHIIRQPINLTRYTPSYPNPDNKEPLIVHAPSDRTIKGTPYLLNAIKRLKAEGFTFKFKMIEKMHYNLALQNYQQADIIIDQLCIGAHGLLSLESMALGKPVICYIREDLLDQYPTELPIVNTNPKTIYNKLKSLINDPKNRYDLGIKGRKYVETHHDAIKIAQQFKSLYEELLNS